MDDITTPASKGRRLRWLTPALLLVSINVWGWLIWREEDLQSRLMRPGYEYDLISPRDDQLDEALREAGRQGWMLSSCRRATSGSGEKSEPLYECIMQKPIRSLSSP